MTFNPISKVRCSAKRLRKKDVLNPSEFRALLDELSVRDRAIVLLAGSTGLRRSEFIGLTWADLDAEKMEIAITRSCFRNVFGETKTECSRRPVPLHPLVLNALLQWKRKSLYRGEGDFLFASTRLNGLKPLSPDSLLKKSIRPALKRAGIIRKVIGWHNFRHSLATNLRAIGVDIKVAQEILRHANSRTTMDVYTHVVSAQKHEATGMIVDFMMQPTRTLEPQHPLAPSLLVEDVASC